MSAMPSAIDTGRGHTWKAPLDAFRIGTASVTPAANAAREITTVTAFGPAGAWVPATPNPRNTRFPVWNPAKTFPRARKQIASYIPAENDSPASSQSRTASFVGVASAAARSAALSCMVPPASARGWAGTGFRRLLLSVRGAAPEASAGPAADDDGGEAGGGAEAEGVPRAGHVGQRADDG